MKSHRKILLYITLKSVNPLYLAINKANVYIKEINESRYLIQIPTDENKYNLKMYGKLWRRIKDDFELKKLITRVMQGIWKSHSIQMMIYP